jgi:hypothetical protein
MLISPKVCLLHNIFGFGVIAQYRVYDAINPLIVTAHQDFIQRGISIPNELDELVV